MLITSCVFPSLPTTPQTKHVTSFKLSGDADVGVVTVVLQIAMSCKAAGEGGGICGGPEEKPGVCCLSP